jgi:Probable Zinc-ribbon domain
VGTLLDDLDGPEHRWQYLRVRRKEYVLHTSLAIERPDLVAQWHPSKNLPLTPHDVTAGVETRVWWKCPKGRDHVWEATVLMRAYKGTGCPFCANRRAGLKNSLAVLAPKVAREWHPTKNGAARPTDVVPGSGKKAWWRCRLGHEWQASIVQRTKVGTGCPYCAGYRVTPERSLVAVAPAVAMTWHPTKNRALKPADVASGSARKVWWLCKRGHEWRTPIICRARQGNGCPMCSGRKLSPERSLATVDPKAAATWHPTRNGRLRPEDVMASSGRKVWWQCSKGPDHEWKVAICARRSTRFACPFCANRRLSCTNSLATVAEEIARDWHPTKNGKLQPSDVVYGSGKIVWWLCKYGHEWSATVSNRTQAGVGCPGCRFDDQLQRRRDKGKLRPSDRALLAVKEQELRRRVGRPPAR